MFCHCSLHKKLDIYYEFPASCGFSFVMECAFYFISNPLIWGPVRSYLKLHINYVPKVCFIPYFMPFFQEFLKDGVAQFALMEAVSVGLYRIMLILMRNLVMN